MIHRETICATATAQGSGAIAVIRISGENAFAIADTLFASASNKKLANQATQTIHFGTIRHESTTIDEVLVSVFKAPHSYTGENMAEISCHASPYIQAELIRLLIKHGARMAHPGEFTQRAFLNGKMDLSQAESVADIISSTTSASHRLALSQLRGGFARELQKMRGELLNFVSLIELELDFSEEEVEFANRSDLSALCASISAHLAKLVSSFSIGNAIKKGIPVAIVGEPNAGKSTLLNTLLNEDKAIVSDIAGTTRDAIEDCITINGVAFRFIDTAGIRHTDDAIEHLGIEKTYKKLSDAEIVILMVDSNTLIEKIQSDCQNICSRLSRHQRLIMLLNKCDATEDQKLATLQNRNLYPELRQQDSLFPISAKQKTHIQMLEEELGKTVANANLAEYDAIVTNERHHQALSLALESALRINEGLQNGLPSDLVALEIRQILHHLGEITGGTITNDEVLGNIFKNFCIGK